MSCFPKNYPQFNINFIRTTLIRRPSMPDVGSIVNDVIQKLNSFQCRTPSHSRPDNKVKYSGKTNEVTIIESAVRNPQKKMDKDIMKKKQSSVDDGDSLLHNLDPETPPKRAEDVKGSNRESRALNKPPPQKSPLSQYGNNKDSTDSVQNEKPLREGDLTVHIKKFGKTGKTNSFRLFGRSESGKPRLQQYSHSYKNIKSDQKWQSPELTITSDSIISVSVTKELPNSFIIEFQSNHSNILLLTADSLDERGKWVKDIRKTLLNIDTKSPSESAADDLKHILLPQTFDVKISKETLKRIGDGQPAQIQIDPGFITVIAQNRTRIAKWGFSVIRKYDADKKNEFHIETGTKAEHGAGHFSFISDEVDQIYLCARKSKQLLRNPELCVSTSIDTRRPSLNTDYDYDGPTGETSPNEDRNYKSPRSTKSMNEKTIDPLVPNTYANVITDAAAFPILPRCTTLDSPKTLRSNSPTSPPGHVKLSSSLPVAKVLIPTYQHSTGTINKKTPQPVFEYQTGAEIRNEIHSPVHKKSPPVPVNRPSSRINNMSPSTTVNSPQTFTNLKSSPAAVPRLSCTRMLKTSRPPLPPLPPPKSSAKPSSETKANDVYAVISVDTLNRTKKALIKIDNHQLNIN